MTRKGLFILFGVRYLVIIFIPHRVSEADYFERVLVCMQHSVDPPERQGSSCFVRTCNDFFKVIDLSHYFFIVISSE